MNFFTLNKLVYLLSLFARYYQLFSGEKGFQSYNIYLFIYLFIYYAQV